MGCEFAGEVMIELATEYQSAKDIRDLCDDIEADLFTIAARVNGSPDLADFKRQVENMKKRIVELRTYVGV